MDEEQERYDQTNYDADFNIVDDGAEECEEHETEIDPGPHSVHCNLVLQGVGA